MGIAYHSETGKILTKNNKICSTCCGGYSCANGMPSTISIDFDDVSYCAGGVFDRSLTLSKQGQSGGVYHYVSFNFEGKMVDVEAICDNQIFKVTQVEVLWTFSLGPAKMFFWTGSSNIPAELQNTYTSSDCSPPTNNLAYGGHCHITV
jgi:hypothetical protein